MRFQANTVRFAKEDGVTSLAFGDEGETPNFGVILQISEEVDDQDRALGLGGLYFEAIHANVSGYRMVSSLTCEGHLVRIELKPSVQSIEPIIEIQANDDSCDNAMLNQTIEMMSNHVL